MPQSFLDQTSSDPVSHLLSKRENATHSAVHVRVLALFENAGIKQRLDRFLARSNLSCDILYADQSDSVLVHLADAHRQFDLVITDRWHELTLLEDSNTALSFAVPLLVLHGSNWDYDLPHLSQFGACLCLPTSTLSIAQLEIAIRTFLQGRRAQLQLRQNFELVKHDYATLRATADEMSQEVLTSAQAIHGYAQLNYSHALQKISDPLTPPYSALTLEASQRLIDITSRYVHRIRGALAQAERPRINITDLVESAIAMARLQFDARAQSLSLMTIGDALYAEVDATALDQALTNLFGYASKNSKDGATIEVLLCDSFDDVKIIVIDHGSNEPAMGTEAAKHHFDIIARVVKDHRGLMEIQDTHEWGCVVTLQLPKARSVGSV